MKRGTLEGTATGLGRSGDARVRCDDGSIHFVRFGVPGERLRFDPTTQRVTDVIEPSAHRVEPPCEKAFRCGGCPLMHVEPAAAFRMVTERVAAVLPTGLALARIHGPHAEGYRRRARFAFVGGQVLGFAAPRSNRVVDASGCRVLRPELEAARAALADGMLPLLKGRGELSIALGREGLPVARVVSELAQSAAVYRAAEAFVADARFAGFVLDFYGSVATLGYAQEWTPSSDGPLEGTALGFSQCNDTMALALAEHVRDYARPEGQRVLELYSGHGHLSVGLARGASRFVSVEIAEPAVVAARRNFARLGLVGELRVGDARAVPTGPFDVVVLDPPRSGAAEAVEAIARLAPRRVVYVACDPEALGRDLRAFATRGYVAVRAASFDMFPHTAHVEAVVALERTGESSAGSTTPSSSNSP